MRNIAGSSSTSDGDKIHRWAVATVTATFLLILAGGLVTSRDAGLAVPDWPLSFGTINPPRWWAIENVRTEHGHRLIAGGVALLTLALARRVRRTEKRGAVRMLAFAAAASVLAQAALGGLRVLHLSVDLAMIHGWFAQGFLCLVVALAVVTSPNWRSQSRLPPVPRHLVLLATCTLALTAGQLVVGVLMRHAGAQIQPLVSSPLLWMHAGAAVAILGLSLTMKAVIDRSAAGEYLARRTRLLVGLVIVQITLGLGSWAVTETSVPAQTATMLESWLPTLHVGVGAAILATLVALSLHAAGRHGSARYSVHADPVAEGMP